MPRPYWYSADDAPWCCWNDRQIIVLTSTEICETCPVWKARQSEGPPIGPIPAPGAMPFREPQTPAVAVAVEVGLQSRLEPA
jgi:hypothetical protein